MTNKDIYEILYDTRRILDSAGKDKVKQIYRILLSGKKKHRCVFLNSADLVQYTKEWLTNFMKDPNLITSFNKSQIKSLYSILSEFHIYPVCPLCNKEIKKYSNNKYPNEFTWDHIIPKSLGGSGDLYNLQPTHKECNNSKGNDMLYHAHYNIEVVVNINFSMDMAKHDKHHSGKNLRKKDYWRQCRCGFCR